MYNGKDMSITPTGVTTASAERPSRLQSCSSPNRLSALVHCSVCSRRFTSRRAATGTRVEEAPARRRPCSLASPTALACCLSLPQVLDCCRCVAVAPAAMCRPTSSTCGADLAPTGRVSATTTAARRRRSPTQAGGSRAVGSMSLLEMAAVNSRRPLAVASRGRPRSCSVACSFSCRQPMESSKPLPCRLQTSLSTTASARSSWRWR